VLPSPDIVAQQGVITALLWATPYNMVFLIYILIGSAIYRAHEQGRALAGIVAVACIFATFIAASRLYETAYPGTIGFDATNAVSALVVFIAFLAIDRFTPPIPIAAFFADISYPLYLIHIPLSWFLLYWMTYHGLNGLYALGLTTAICIALAYVLHILIERPAQRYGKSFGERPGSVIVLPWTRLGMSE